MGKFIVHTVPGSPFARAALATRIEKGADYALSAIPQSMMRTARHLALHPFGRIPILEHDGFKVYETQAIVRYIDRVLPNPALTPSDARAAAKMDQMMNVNDWYVFQGVGAVIGFQRIVKPLFLNEQADEAAIEAAMPKAHLSFAELSKALGDQDYFAGNALSLADLMLAPQVDFLAATPEFAKLVDGKDNLLAWLKRMQSRRSMQETTPEKVVAMAKPGG